MSHRDPHSAPSSERFSDVWQASGWMVAPLVGTGVLLAGLFIYTDVLDGIGPERQAKAHPATVAPADAVLPPLRDEDSAEAFARRLEAEQLQRTQMEVQQVRDARPPLVVADEPIPCGDPAECPEVDACQITAQIVGPAGDPTVGHLSLARVDHLGKIATWNAVTNADGAHRFSDLPQGEYHLTVDVDGAALQAGPPYVCKGDGARAFFHLKVTTDAVPFEGRLVGHGGKVPVGASVLIEQPGAAVSQMLGVAHLPVADDGTFTTRLAPGRYRLVAKAPHHQATFRDFTVSNDDKRARMRLKLEWKPTARGTVYAADGSPKPGVHVFLGPIYSPKVGYKSVVTDHEGKFEIPLIVGQSHTIAAYDPSHGLGSLRVKAVKRTGGHKDLKLTLKKGRTVGGMVMTPTGAPHVLGDVRYRIKELGIEGVVRTDTDGRFTIENAPRYPVEMWPEGGALGAWGGAAATVNRPNVLLRYQKPAY